MKKVWKAEIADHVIGLAWSPAGTSLAAAAVSGPIQVLSSTGKLTANLAGHGFGTTSISWNSSGQLLASSGQDGKVRIWEAGKWAEAAAMPGGAAWVEQVSWHPASDFLVSAAGKKMRLWSATGSLLREFRDHRATIADLAWRPRLHTLTTATYGGVALWNLDSSDPEVEFTWLGSILKLAWSPDGRHLAHGNQDASVHYWIVESGEDLEMPGYPLKVREICWDPSGRYLATGGGDQVTVWDCAPPGPAETTPLSFLGHEGPIQALSYQHQGPVVASGGEDGMVFLFRPGKFESAIARADLGVPIAQLCWSPDDRLLAVGSQTGQVVVYSVK